MQLMLLLATEIWKSHGGVQRYMESLTRIFGSNPEPFTLVTLLDRTIDRPPNLTSDSAICCAGSKWRFCLEAFLVSWRDRPALCIVGHPCFALVAWCLRFARLIERYVVVLHGTESWLPLSMPLSMAARRADAVIATTNYTVTEFCFYNRVAKNHCVVIPLASTLPLGSDSGAKRSPCLRVLTISRLSNSDSYKGIDTLLCALRKVKDRGSLITLDIVGDGDDRARLQGLAKSFHLDDSVHFAGRVSDSELEPILAQANVFALPSKKEGFGIVFVEAMSHGLPCIGANHGGIPEVIDPGVNGYLVEYGDASQLAFYLQAFIESPHLLAQMGQSARRKVETIFSFEAMANSWLAFVASISRTATETRTAISLFSSRQQ